ncbi:uncharacterized protein N0V89_004406 [Didymosphaeria variabile]|uniref:F-box domain-containing protein n=1 Tax=Didymosphaeria variabile TaxID=1932322 RepID=A0A9W8XS42_9PLEO|nr:uncharacterized protein N0V89_004406 [Didymosphaeria variabile]KAJ4356373.1 hypothetical protein N0V89_004406 [Didymosphaeria variabile]
MSLAQLSTEVQLLIAINLSQLDLLNVSLTSKRLHAATEPALYQEYHPPSLRRRSLSLFIKALLKEPKRLHYVHSLRLPEWEILDAQNEENRFEPEAVQEEAMSEGKKLYHSMTVEWDPNRKPGQDLNQYDYELLTGAAAATGLVKNTVPYANGGVLELRSVEKSYDCYHSTLYYWYYFATTELESLPLDDKICHLLRAGVDDAYIMTLEELLLNKDSAEYYAGAHPADRFEDQPFRSLAQFTCLEKLWAPTNMWANLPGAWEESRDPGLTNTFAGLLPPCLKELRLFDSHAQPVLKQPVLDNLLQVAGFELRELMSIEVVSKHDHSKKDLNILEEEREIRRDSGSVFTYRFRWSHFHSFELPKTAEELEPRCRYDRGPTFWTDDRYTTRSWECLQAPDILSYEEVEEQRALEEQAILAEVEDAPTCNDEIWELEETRIEEVAMGLRYVQDA